MIIYSILDNEIRLQALHDKGGVTKEDVQDALQRLTDDAKKSPANFKFQKLDDRQTAFALKKAIGIQEERGRAELQQLIDRQIKRFWLPSSGKNPKLIEKPFSIGVMRLFRTKIGVAMPHLSKEETQSTLSQMIQEAFQRGSKKLANNSRKSGNRPLAIKLRSARYKSMKAARSYSKKPVKL